MNGLTQLRTAQEISEIRGEEVSGPKFTIETAEIKIPEVATS
jgi:hypothetical protein